ncbi:hypothetical protein INT48_007724 [Thamnidium elegans]|uniref:Uncharacterized protein n=1 Tax=Thamnidium elegans TaxID=101142 RepID=A0A8H7SR41_9FUNG|nr:hypothetical protein INT48_007724 [Thamnidium elegans]
MAPQRQKRIKRKLPSRNIVDADFVSSSTSARIMDDLLLPSHHDRAILSSLWDNQETTRSELPHVVIASTRRQLVQPSTNTLEKTYLQRLQEQRKDTTDLSAQSIIPIALVNNMNAKATTTANATDSDSEQEAETYTTLSPINQQVGMNIEQTFSYGVSLDQSTQDDDTGLCPDETDHLQLSLNVLQVSGIDRLLTQGSLHNENPIENALLLQESHVTELIEREPDHSNVPMVTMDPSAVNDQAPVSIGQAVMMEDKDMMEVVTVNENDMIEEADDVNEKDITEAEIVIEKYHIVDNVNEKDNGENNVNEKDNGVNNVDKREGLEAEEEGVKVDEEGAREDEEVLVEAYEEEGVREDEEALVEADKSGDTNEEEVVEEPAVANEEADEEEHVNKEKDPVGPSTESNQPSFDAEEEISLCIRSVEPSPCLFLTTIRDPQKEDDLVPIKQEPLDASEYASSTEEFMNNAARSSDEFMKNVVYCHEDKCMNNASASSTEEPMNNVACSSDEITNNVVSCHADTCMSNTSSCLSEEFTNTAASYCSDEIMNSGLSVYSQKCINIAVSDNSDQTTKNGISDETTSNAISNYSVEYTDNVLPCTSDDFMNNIASCYSDVCISEEEALSLQVLSEEPSSCLYRMSLSIEREDGLVPIKQEPIDEVPVDMASLAHLINPYPYDMAATLGMYRPADTEVRIKQELLEIESSAEKEYDPMDIEYQSPDLQDNPEISDMQDIAYSEENDETETEQDNSAVHSGDHAECYVAVETLSGQEETTESIDSPSDTGSSSTTTSVDDNDWIVAEELEDEQDLVYKNIFNIMSKPIMTKPGQNKGRKRFRPDAWIEDNTSTIVLTSDQKERIYKRRKVLKAKLQRPFIMKKQLKCVWFVETDIT